MTWRAISARPYAEEEEEEEEEEGEESEEEIDDSRASQSLPHYCLCAQIVPVYPYTLATSSSLAWPPARRLVFLTDRS